MKLIRNELELKLYEHKFIGYVVAICSRNAYNLGHAYGGGQIAKNLFLTKKREIYLNKSRFIHQIIWSIEDVCRNLSIKDYQKL